MNRIDEAFQNIPRSEFLPEKMKKYADEDRPLDIGFGQTNSQPTTVRMMLKWLGVEEGDKVLEVGSGSGWTSAMLAYLVGSDGSVDSVEKITELLEFGRANCERNGIYSIAFHQAGNSLGWHENSPYDKIIVNACTSQLPIGLIGQLKPGRGSKMVIPVHEEVLEVTMNNWGEIHLKHHPGFVFVPLVT